MLLGVVVCTVDLNVHRMAQTATDWSEVGNAKRAMYACVLMNSPNRRSCLYVGGIFQNIGQKCNVLCSRFPKHIGTDRNINLSMHD